MHYLNIQPEYLFGIALFISTLALLVTLKLVIAPVQNPVHRRLQSAGGSSPLSPTADSVYRGFEGSSATVQAAQPAPLPPVITQFTRAASKPFIPKDPINLTKLRNRMTAAGIYSPHAVPIFITTKLVLMGGGFIAAFIAGQMFSQMIAFIAGYAALVLGYSIPTMWLSRMVAKRHQILDHSLPDALDLMVVCVESGLTLDAAIQRVGNEITLAHPEIAQELQITQMETRVGVSRADAMRNLGQRTDLASLRSLAAMLVQAERFGTGIAQALRVQAESLRIKRQHLAEAAAVKSTVKLAFPVVLFIFPTILVVLGAPAVIHLIDSPLFKQ